MSVILSTPVLDLHKISVGTMANLVKAAIKAGHPRYVPLDGRKISYSSFTFQFVNVIYLLIYFLFVSNILISYFIYVSFIYVYFMFLFILIL